MKKKSKIIFFVLSNIFESEGFQNDQKLSSKQLDELILSWLGNQLNLSLLSFDFNCSVL